MSDDINFTNRDEQLPVPGRRYPDDDPEGRRFTELLIPALEELNANSLVSSADRSNHEPLEGLLFVPTGGSDPWSIGDGDSWNPVVIRVPTIDAAEATVGDLDAESVTIGDGEATLSTATLGSVSIDEFDDISSAIGGGFDWDDEGRLAVAIENFGSVEGMTLPVTQNIPLAGYDIEGPGRIGTSENPISIHAEDAVITTPSQIGPRLIAGSESYPTIQSAIDALAVKDGTSRFTDQPMQEVYIPPKPSDTNETVVLNKKHTALVGQRGQGTYIEQSGDSHTIETTQNDVRLSYLGVGHRGTGDYDAIHVGGTGVDEVTIEQCAVDWAPRHGINVNNVPHCYLDGVEATGGEGGAALRLQGNYIRATDTKVQLAQNVGVFCDGYDNGRFSGMIETTNGYGMKLGNNCSHVRVDVSINKAGGDGLIVGGDYHLVDTDIWDSGGADLRITGSENVVHVMTQGSVVIESGAQNNRVIGNAGSVTDNGTNNDLSALSSTKTAGVHAYPVGPQSLTAGTSVPLKLSESTFDHRSELDAENDRVNISRRGTYTISGQVAFENMSDGATIVLDILVNGSRITRVQNNVASEGSSPRLSTTISHELVTGDTLTAEVLSSESANISGGPNDGTFLEAIKID